MPYKIVYIDEQQEDVDSFQKYVSRNDTDREFTVEHLLPLESLEEMMESLLKISADALVSDFMLNEHKESIQYTVPYTGVDLVSEYQSIRTDFPAFVLTSYDLDAAKNVEDVNLIYDKTIYSNTHSSQNMNFLDRVKLQINHYQSKLGDAERQLALLRDKSGKVGLNIKEEQELIELDSFLEASINGRSTIPTELKSLSNMQKLEELIAKVDYLVQEIDDSEVQHGD